MFNKALPSPAGFANFKASFFADTNIASIKFSLGSIRLGKRGWSLAELLVAIAIVSILSSLIFFGAKNLLQKTRIIQCLNNMRQTGLAFHAYGADRDGRLPTQTTREPSETFITMENTWAAQLLPYAGSYRVMTCSEDKTWEKYHIYTAAYLYNSYAATYALTDSSGSRPVEAVRFSNSKNPTKDALLVDCRTGGYRAQMVSAIMYTPPGMSYTQWFPHPPTGVPGITSKRSVLFVDGHVELRGTDVPPENWEWPRISILGY